MPDPMTDAQPEMLDATLDALASGATGLTPTRAFGLIDHWKTACRAEGLTDVVAGLDKLGELLRADRLDGRTIGAALRELAASSEAAGAGTPVAGSMERLGASLVRIAGAIGG